MRIEISELVDLVNHHVALYEILSKFLDRESEALLHQELDILNEINQAKEQVGREIIKSTDRLGQAIRILADKIGIPQSPYPTLAELAAHVPAPWSQSLERASLALARYKRRIARANEANKAYAEEAVELIAGSIAILTGASSQAKSGYAPTGRRSRTNTYGPTKLSREV